MFRTRALFRNLWGPVLHQIVRLCAVLGSVLAISGCDLPRGAALSSEILKEQKAGSPTFSVVPVRRDTVARLASWPATGGGGGSFRWPQQRRGPDSPVIRAGDSLDVTIWDSQENSLLTPATAQLVALPSLTVSTSGAVFLPYVGDVLVSGQTPPEARRTLQAALDPVVPSAQVQVDVKAGKLNTIDLVSGVNTPGPLALPDRNFSVLAALAAGGGVAPFLRNPVLRLIRNGKTYGIRTDRLFSDASKDIALQGGDKLIVEEDRRYFTAFGATGAEKLVYFEKDRITALEAVSLAGGLSDGRANPKAVLILRDYAARDLRQDDKGPRMRQVVFTFDLTQADGLFAARAFPVHPMDTVLATESPVVAAQSVLGLAGSFFGLRQSATAN